MKNIVSFLCFIIIGNATFAQSSIRAKQYATEYGKSLMNTYGTDDAKNCKTVVVEAETEGSDYIMEIEVSWEDIEGAIFKDDVTCIIKGVLTVKTDGTNKRFSETYRNDAFAKIAKGQKRLELVEKVAKKAIENSIDKPSQFPKDPNGPFEYKFFNNNGKEILIYFTASPKSKVTSDDVFVLQSKSDYTYISKTGAKWNSANLQIANYYNGTAIIDEFTVYPSRNYKIIYKSNGHSEISELQF